MPDCPNPHAARALRRRAILDGLAREAERRARLTATDREAADADLFARFDDGGLTLPAGVTIAAPPPTTAYTDDALRQMGVREGTIAMLRGGR